MYRNVGTQVVEEDAPLAINAPEPFGAAVRATLEGERLATATEGIVGVALRYGQLYGSGTYFAAGGDFQRQARARMLPIVGSGAGIFSFLHVTDAATAAIAALDRWRLDVATPHRGRPHAIRRPGRPADQVHGALR